MIVTWDQAKADLNLRKHGVSFEEAQTVLENSRLLVLDDDDHDEPRFIAMGLSARARLLIVIYCYRFEDIIRIISARKATRKERSTYEKRV